MDTAETRSPLRILAPVALVIFGLALVLIISTANSGGGGGGTSSSSAEKARDLGTGNASKTKTRKRDKLPKSVYVVKTGDTLGSISQKVGVSVAKLQELNPNLDQFSLVAGQKIKIR